MADATGQEDGGFGIKLRRGDRKMIMIVARAAVYAFVMFILLRISPLPFRRTSGSWVIAFLLGLGGRSRVVVDVAFAALLLIVIVPREAWKMLT